MSSSSRSLVWRLAWSQLIGDAETSDISQVVSSPLNLAAVSLSPTCPQAARRRFHWTLIQINAVPVHHATENGGTLPFAPTLGSDQPIARLPCAMGDSIV